MKAGVPESLDEGFIALSGAADCYDLSRRNAGELRFWERAAAVKQV